MAANRTLRIKLARVFGVLAFVCGVIGLIAGLAGKVWKLGVTGWFEGGVLLAVLAVVLLIADYLAYTRSKGA